MGDLPKPTDLNPVSLDDMPLPGALLRLRRYEATVDRPELVLCASDNAYALDLCAGKSGLTIYSESISVSKSKEIDGHVGLYTHQLIVVPHPEPNSSSKITISCNGKKGADDITGVDGAKEGNPGWNLNFYQEESSPATPAKVYFSAQGGRGGDGHNAPFEEQKPRTGAGTNGSNGGKGGDVRLIFGGVLGRAIHLGRGALDMRLELAPDELTARKLFEDRFQSLITFLYICNTIPWETPPRGLEDQLNVLEVILGYPWVEYPLRKERALVRSIVSKLGAAADGFCLRMVEQVTVTGGDWGDGGVGALNRSRSGAAGASGKLFIDYNFLRARALCQTSVPFAHPDQCSMVLELAKFYFFQASLHPPPKVSTHGEERKKEPNLELEQCHAYLSRLQKRLLFLDAITPNDPLYKAYQDAEYSMRILRRSESTKVGQEAVISGETESSGFLAGEVSALAALRDIQVEVDAILRQIAQQVDYYGHPQGYVPRASYKFYERLLTPLLKNLEVAEEAHKLYFQKSQTAEKRKEAIATINKQVEHSIKEHEDAVDRLKDFMKSQISLATILHSKLKTAQDTLKTKLTQASVQIASLTPWLGLSLMDFVEAGTMLCFCPHPAMIGVQATGLLVKGFTNAGIRNAKGDYIDKTLLVEQIKTINGDAQSILAAYQEVKNSGSKLQIDDPGATKIVVQKSEVMKLLKEFKNKLQEKSLTDVESAFQQYIDIATERNTTIMAYNSTFDAWAQTQQTIAYLDERRKNVSPTINDVDPDLAAVALFMERSYNQTLRNVLEMFYLAQKAIQFWSLEYRNYLGETLKDNVVSNVSYASLKRLQTDVLLALQSVTESHAHDAPPFTGLPFHLDEANVNELRLTTETVLRIPTNSTGMNGKGFPFVGMNSVRLTKVRFWLPGATSSDGVLRIKLLHMGQETIVDKDGVEHDFQHEQIPFNFQYHIASNGKFVEGELKTIDGEIGRETKSDYALVGPFTTWKISVHSWDTKANFDLSNITGAYFEFHGTGYATA